MYKGTFCAYPNKLTVKLPTISKLQKNTGNGANKVISAKNSHLQNFKT